MSNILNNKSVIFRVFISFIVLSSLSYCMSKEEFKSLRQKDMKEFVELSKNSNVFSELKIKDQESFELFSLYLNKILLTAKIGSKSFEEHTKWLKYKSLYQEKKSFFYPAFYAVFLDEQKMEKSATDMALLAIVRLEIDSLRCKKFPKKVYTKWIDDLKKTNTFSRFKNYSNEEKQTRLNTIFKVEKYQIGRAKDDKLCNKSFISDRLWLSKRKDRLKEVYEELLSE